MKVRQRPAHTRETTVQRRRHGAVSDDSEDILETVVGIDMAWPGRALGQIAVQNRQAGGASGQGWLAA